MLIGHPNELAFRALALRHSLWRSLNFIRFFPLPLATVANFQLSWYNQIILLPPPTLHHSFFRNFHP